MSYRGIPPSQLNLLFAIYDSWGLPLVLRMEHCPRPGAEGTQLKNNKMLVGGFFPLEPAQVT